VGVEVEKEKPERVERLKKKPKHVGFVEELEEMADGTTTTTRRSSRAKSLRLGMRRSTRRGQSLPSCSGGFVRRPPKENSTSTTCLGFFCSIWPFSFLID
jgi:hypothetical protein